MFYKLSKHILRSFYPFQLFKHCLHKSADCVNIVPNDDFISIRILRISFSSFALWVWISCSSISFSLLFFRWSKCKYHLKPVVDAFYNMRIIFCCWYESKMWYLLNQVVVVGWYFICFVCECFLSICFSSLYNISHAPLFIKFTEFIVIRSDQICL